MIARFLDNAIPEPNSGCWLWMASVDRWGYGRFYLGGKQQAASRCAWRLFRGDIPHGIHVLHRCDNPPCVNPDHLFLGTPGDNMRDMQAKGRGRGHPRGSLHPRSKLTEADVAAIRAEYASARKPGATRNAKGYGVRALGAKYGVSQTTVHRIVAGEMWTYLPGEER